MNKAVDIFLKSVENTSTVSSNLRYEIKGRKVSASVSSSANERQLYNTFGNKIYIQDSKRVLSQKSLYPGLFTN